MKIVRLTKIKDCDNSCHPNHIDPGYVKEGSFVSKPIIGQSFWVGLTWATSQVKKIISDHKFETLNSIYEWRVIKGGKNDN